MRLFLSILITFFTYSCSNIERVEDYSSSTESTQEPVKERDGRSFMDKLKGVDKFVTTSTHETEEPEAEIKRLGYREIECGENSRKSRKCVKKVAITAPNQFDIRYVWIEYDEIKENQSMLSSKWSLYAKVFVQDKKRDTGDEWFGYKSDVDIDNKLKAKENLLEDAEDQMENIIEKILSKRTDNE